MCRRRVHGLRVAGLLVSGCLLIPGCRGPDAAGGSDDSSETGGLTDEDKARADMAEELDLERRDFPLLIWSAWIVQNDYFDRARFAPRGQLSAAMDQLGLHTPEFFGALEGDALEVTVRSAKKRFPLDGVQDLRAAADVLEQVLVFVRDELSLEDEPLHELEYEAINGFFAPLDPHTILLTPEQHADLGVKTRGRFGGIGAEIQLSQRRVKVARVLPESPSERAGLLAGDLLLEIDGQSTVNMELAEAQELLRGPVQTKVKVRVQRGDDKLDVEITRDTILIESVRHELLPDRIGYMRISGFQEDTAQKAAEALQIMKVGAGGELAGLIVDVRGNSGGLMTQATGLLDLMVTEGELVIVRSVTGREQETATEKLELPADVQVVALVDENSASAAEILSGSVKHLGRGLVLGRPTFGKGSVQMLRPASPYGRELALKMTVAEYRVAGERKVQTVGVRPDLELLPVQVTEVPGVARYYDEERFERARERYRTAHLPSAAHEHGADAFVSAQRRRLRYLDDRGLDIGEQPAEGAPEVMGDPEVRLAHEVVRGLEGAATRSEAEAKLDALLGDLEARQDALIAEALEASVGVKWAGKPAVAGKASLEVTAKLPEGPVRPGEPFVLKVSVSNSGAEAVERVHLVTDCDRDELDGIELMIGSLEPGASAERQVELYVLPWHRNLTDTLRVQAEAGEPDGELEGSAEVTLQVEGPPRPRFAFDYWIVDDPALAAKAPKRPDRKLFPGEKPFEVVGNGDGLLQPGEQVLLAFRARNDGAGPAPDARAVVRNLSGTQGLLEEGEVALGALGVGKEVRGAFGVSISPTADPALPLELEIVVGDGQVRERVDDRVRLRVLPDRPAFVAKADVAVARSTDLDGAELVDVRLHVGADDSAGVAAYLPAGAGVNVVGTAGPWVAVAGEPGQRLWASGDLLELGHREDGKIRRPDHLMVDPPRISVSEVPREVESASVVLSGVVTHPDRARDVMVQTLPSGNRGAERKVFYLENPHVDGLEARRLEFSAEIPLEPGANRIMIRTRDADKVERREEVWVYRR